MIFKTNVGTLAKTKLTPNVFPDYYLSFFNY